MNDEIRRILKWSVIGGIVAAAITLMVSGGMPLGIRITCALMAFGAGAVTAALLAANFAKDEESESHGPPGAGSGPGH